MKTHADIVAAADVLKLAADCGVSVHTVRSWGQRNSIPAEHWPVFVEAGKATLVELAAGVKPRARKAPDQQVAA